jgi:hypothetical protein
MDERLAGEAPAALSRCNGLNEPFALAAIVTPSITPKIGHRPILERLRSLRPYLQRRVSEVLAPLNP